MAGNGNSDGVAGILLTGGASRRMGESKTTLLIEGCRLADLIGSKVAVVASPVIEVGPGDSGLRAVREEPPGQGPLVAIVAGWAELKRVGHRGPVLVVAGDLPLVTVEVLRLVADWPYSGSVVPRVGGRRQPLCARWSVTDLGRAVAAAASGERSLRSCFGEGTLFLEEDAWGHLTGGSAFADVDTTEDLARLGISPTGNA
jgi:molybdopterin-guanine dinucleotide biosynthesis protein A